MRDLSKIQSGIREKPKRLDGIRDLTATRNARFAKIMHYTGLAKDNGTRGADNRCLECGIVVKKEWELGIRTNPIPPSFPDSEPHGINKMQL